MPIYMDVHIVPGCKAKGVAEAHRLDTMLQEDFGCKCMTYWIDEERESIFCLIEAPEKKAVEEMHNQAHGLIPHKIIEVNTNIVESFLGRIFDPSDAKITDEGLKVFRDPSFRTLLVTSITDPVVLQNKHGRDAITDTLDRINNLVRRFTVRYEGREVEHDGHGFIVSFVSASNAVSCALQIQKEIAPDVANTVGFRIAINCGEPIEQSNRLFGDTVQLAKNICTIARANQVAITSAVKDLVAKDFQKGVNNFFNLSPQDENFLKQLFSQLEENWQNADFDVDDYCRAMAMSRSQLYRKTISLTGMSPNILLKEFRLEAARDMMKKQRLNIAQVTFNSGFTSPSYFTKCFRKKYGLLPMAYVELLH